MGLAGPLKEASGGKGRQGLSPALFSSRVAGSPCPRWAQIDCDMIGGRINSGASVSG